VPAATAAGTATTAVAASPQRQRSTFLDLGEPMVPGLARHPRRRQCRHGATLAPSRLEGLLALAVETRSKGGSGSYCAGATGPDRAHGREKWIVGAALDLQQAAIAHAHHGNIGPSGDLFAQRRLPVIFRQPEQDCPQFCALQHADWVRCRSRILSGARGRERASEWVTAAPIIA
jgi:hypothetical protein